MAEFEPAIAITLRHEGGYADDDTRRADHVAAYRRSHPGASEEEASAGYTPTGEVVNRGITHWFLRSVGFLAPLPRSIPATAAEKLLVRNLSVDTTEKLYREYFWRLYRCGDIADQGVGAKYLDICVNTGPEEGALILQRAVNSVPIDGALPIAVDGSIGPLTIGAANRLDPAALMAAIRIEGAAFYEELGQQNPAKYPPYIVAEWIDRLNS